ncbi:MAG: DnaA regulatory inactivator Hda, partial [Pseudomonadales bacterium]|nr:DnaA regulatory inactivator Hda [Pseudomonadales bacterium]
MSSRQLTLNIKLRDDATFSNYIGEAAERLRNGTPLVHVWGDEGSGRSHLLEAACHEAHNDGASAIYIAGLDEHGSEILRDLESVELVCLDDIDRVLGDESWELALFHL